MWLLSLRDLQFRRRRFAIAVVATGLVFSITLLLSGFSSTLHMEVRRIVATFGADSWVVAEGTSGPFTASNVLPAQAVRQVADSPGVERARPLILFHSSIREPTPKDINVIGYDGAAEEIPGIDRGRAPNASGEAIADAALGLEPGATATVAGTSLKIVGVAEDITYYFGQPTIFLGVTDAARISFSGRPLVTTVVTDGIPRSLPPGLEALSSDEVRIDLERPLSNGTKSIDLMSGLLWITAAGIIGSIIFLSALERMRDFAVLKATGASNRSLMAGLALQAIVLSVTAAVIAVILAQLLAPLFPFKIIIPARSYVSLLLIAIVVGLLASVAGLRRAATVEPALAFGGA